MKDSNSGKQNSIPDYMTNETGRQLTAWAAYFICSQLHCITPPSLTPAVHYTCAGTTCRKQQDMLKWRIWTLNDRVHIQYLYVILGTCCALFPIKWAHTQYLYVILMYTNAPYSTQCAKYSRQRAAWRVKGTKSRNTLHSYASCIYRVAGKTN